MSSASYDLSSVVNLENIVAKMIADQASGASNFTGGSTPAATAAPAAAATASGTLAGRFTATYDTTGVPTDLNQTITGLVNRIATNILLPLIGHGRYEARIDALASTSSVRQAQRQAAGRHERFGCYWAHPGNSAD
jgi:hypothetical protein